MLADKKRLLILAFVIIILFGINFVLYQNVDALGNDINTTFLLHMDGPSGSTTFIESAIGNTTAHNLTSINGAAITNTWSKWGNSTFFNNSKIFISDTIDNNWSNSNFTWEAWVNITTKPTSDAGRACIIATNTCTNDQNCLLFMIFNTGVGWTSNTVETKHPVTITNGLVYHLALVRVGNVLITYVNGTSVGSAAYTNYLDPEGMSLGGKSIAENCKNYTGFIDEVRLSRGVARWTTNFTVPESPYSTSDVTPPYFTVISNVSIYNNQSVSSQFNASDAEGFDSFTINWTNTFNISKNGLLQNTTGLALGLYFINVTINDTSNNLNSTIIMVNVTTSNINIPTFVNPSDSNLGWYDRRYILANLSTTMSSLSNLTIYLYNSSRNIINQTLTITSPNYKNYSVSSDGVYYINGTACDTDNTCLNSETRAITIDTVTPQIDFNTATLPNGVNLSQNFIYVNVTINETNIMNITYTLYNNSNINNCYQESANVTNQTGIDKCSGLNYTGKYDLNTAGDGSLMIDGDWSTSTELSGGSDLYSYINYTKPNGMSLSTVKIQIKDTGGIKNYTIPQSCLDYSNTLIEFFIRGFTSDGGGFQYACLNSTGWSTFNVTTGVGVAFAVYDEAIIWSDPSIVNQTTWGSREEMNFTDLPDGKYWYNVKVTDIVNKQATTSLRSITLDKTAPNAVIISPLNNTATSNTTINFTYNVSDADGLDNATIYVYNKTSNTLINQTTTLLYGALNFLIGIPMYLVDTVYNWAVVTFDIAGNQNTTLNYTLTIDTHAPKLYLTPPNNSEFIITSEPYALSITSEIRNNNESALSSCWYGNTTTNTSLTCYNNATINFTAGYKTIYWYANDSANNLGSNASTYLVNRIYTDISYPTMIIEGQNNSVAFYINSTVYTNASGTVNLNGTLFPMTILNAGTNLTLISNITAPSVDNDVNLSMQVNYTFNGMNYSTGIYYILDYNIQNFTISSNCSPASLSFNVIDEENLTQVYNNTFEYNFDYGVSAGNVTNIHGNITDQNGFNVCINTSASTNYTITKGEIYYTSTGYTKRRYYIFSGTIINATLQNITLVNLKSTEQTSFKMTVESSSLLAYGNRYIEMLRWYPRDNSYRIVDMGLTDDQGNSVVHVKVEDVDYKISVFEQNGSLIKSASPVRLVCQSVPCEYNLKITPSEIDYTSSLKIDTNFSYNQTSKIWRLSFNDRTGTNNTINFSVFKITDVSTYGICTNVTSGVSGVLTCNTSIYTGMLKGIVTKGTSSPVTIASKLVNVFSSSFTSNFGLWLTLLLAIPIIFTFAVMSPVFAIIGGIIALIPALYFGSINYAIITGIAVLGGITIHYLKRVS